ncbi:hypothetical protein EBS80_05345 [bacterium]|nr:hypothetical protein [bacterium]
MAAEAQTILSALIATLQAENREPETMFPPDDEEVRSWIRNPVRAMEIFAARYQLDTVTRALCAIITHLETEDGEEATAQRLGSKGIRWWTNHKAEDARRRQREAELEESRKRREAELALARTARAKLTDDEFAVLIARHREL